VPTRAHTRAWAAASFCVWSGARLHPVATRARVCAPAHVRQSRTLPAHPRPSTPGAAASACYTLRYGSNGDLWNAEFGDEKGESS
jgi:hypothetical protein